MIIKKGSRGNSVKEIQKVLGLKEDGIFGPYTEAAVKKYQRQNGLVVDGIVGENTFESLMSENSIDTDRFGYDDSNDTDGKLEYLGSYSAKNGLVIDRAYLDSDEYVRDYGKIEPKYLFIHHTAGWNNPYRTIDSWNRDRRGRVATKYCIGGINIRNREDKYDGTVVESFPDNYTAWHLGKVGNFNISKFSVGIEINNFGYLEKVDGKYYTYVKTEVPEDMVVDLGYEFRGYRYWHKYTESQLESLKLLIEHINHIYPKIDIKSGLPQMLKNGVEPKDAFEFNPDAYYGRVEGLYSHTNVRKDKYDCYPDDRLVKLLKEL